MYESEINENPVKKKKPGILLILLCILFLLISGACIAGAIYSCHMLEGQYTYERYQGEGSMPFSQISVFMPADQKLSMENINSFRSEMLSAFQNASIDITDGTHFTDCWSCEGSCKINGERNHGNANVFAVGGNYFYFHPLKLDNGSYFYEDDLMKDNILLDEDLAWFLFGGYDLEGQIVHVGDIPLRIAGVVAHEDDYASKKAYKASSKVVNKTETPQMSLYMSYETYLDISAAGDDAAKAKLGITCYEACIPNPVKNFAKKLADEKFPKGNGEIVENARRFSLPALLKIAKNFSARAIHGNAVYPYWENAARYAETRAAMLVCFAIFFALLPLVEFIIVLSVLFSRAKEKLGEDILPAWGEKIEEAIRVRQRRRWEKKHHYVAKH